MTQVIITQILGTVEITEGGKKITAKKGSKISIDAKIKTGSNGKVELEADGKTFLIQNDSNVNVKDIIKADGGNSGTTVAAGVRG
ncbi:MAG TPA: hypothetical protein PK079_21945 [Leptospiraceae bacterium]|nr:hypothetical protein [Leptospiraceae bacterium]HMW05534.1 hypothetical protein [Leptospiraceae bacterium]HMX34142.1 hypothetical protein [Leptospiraceae bacterium]HMY31044.1 hypothetical protein [Leptospiraceae bacterium]HMZ67349.1 hypothetical protein [Leptospiraceae bacterium]